MIVRVWGKINSQELDFTPVIDKPGYYEGYGPKNKNSFYEDIEIYAKNHLGAIGHLQCQVVIREWSPTKVQLLIAPYKIILIERWKAMIESQNFTFGERKVVTACITSMAKQPFEIKNATYSLKYGDEEEASGHCIITEITPIEFHLGAMISPLRPNAVYRLEYRYDIGGERLIYICKILVSGGTCHV